MNQTKKIAFLEKQSEALKQKNKDLESYNKKIVMENQSLKDMIASKQIALIKKEEEIKRIIDFYESQLKELNEIRFNYAEAVLEAEALCDKYKREVQSLIARIRQKK